MLTLAFWFLVALVVYQVLLVLRNWWKDVVKARSLGCKPVPSYYFPVWDVLGVTGVREAVVRTKDFTFVDLLRERHDIVSKRLGRPVLTYKFNLLGSQFIVTADPENIKAVLATQFTDFGLSGERAHIFSPLLGPGIFTSDGKEWETHRALLRPSFARERVSQLDLEDRHVRNLMKALPIVSNDGWTSTVDMQVLFFRLTLDSATEFLFGESVNSQLIGLEKEGDSQKPAKRIHDERTFATAFDMAQNYLAQRTRYGDMYYLCNPKEFQKACKECHNFIDYYVNLALDQELREKEQERGPAKPKDKYVFLEELAQQTRDPLELRHQLLHILLAGRDTTASLLGWVFFLLARSPEKYARLRTAVLETFGSYASSEEITFAKLKGCQYLQACLNETLRLFPVVPLNSRKAMKDTTIPRGGGPSGQDPVFVKKGQTIAYSVAVMHREEPLWGEDAKEFRPDRWEGRRQGWEFLPFNGGPRICLGQQFALTSAGYATVKLLQRFDRIDNADPSTKILQNATLTSCSGTGVLVKLHEAK